jgi:Flp pilus assembly protein TadB
VLTGSVGSLLLTAAAAMLLWPASGGRVARRARALHSARPGVDRGAASPSAPASARRRWILAGGAGLATALLLGDGTGLVAGLLAAGGADRLLRTRAPDDARALRAALVRELPGACDLLAVCLAAGVPVGSALAAVGAAVPPPVGTHLSTVAGLYRLGAEPRRAWADVPEALAGLGRVLVRAGESGAAVAPGLRSLAADSRAAARSATDGAVRRAGVWILAPLGLCFLPAFVCLGVVPLVLGIASGVFG